MIRTHSFTTTWVCMAGMRALSIGKYDWLSIDAVAYHFLYHKISLNGMVNWFSEYFPPSSPLYCSSQKKLKKFCITTAPPKLRNVTLGWSICDWRTHVECVEKELAGVHDPNGTCVIACSYRDFELQAHSSELPIGRFALKSTWLVTDYSDTKG